ncbi:MAG: HNH endonuclease [Bdellovibrionales bacterium]
MFRWVGILSCLGGLVAGDVAFADFPTKPNPEITTGDFCRPENPDFHEYRRYGSEQIAYCHRNVSRFTKKQIYGKYRVPARCRRDYTVDHFVPLSMGGSNEPENLWPEHHNVKAARQDLEQNVFNQLREGYLSQSEAVEIVVHAKMNPPPVEPAECQ